MKTDMHEPNQPAAEANQLAALRATDARRHDLDALRAVAMLLGIALHAALSFVELPWVVQDSQQNGLFGLFFFAVHGFRMPLFFLVSGFFTTMLWRKRGLKSLVKHRAKRILVPCLLGLITIVPLLAWVSGIAIESANGGAVAAEPESFRALTDAVRKNDVDAIQAQLEAGAEINAQDATFGVVPLSWSALYGHEEATRVLLENDADVNAANRDGGRPLHAAALLGQADVVALLLEHGADRKAKDKKGVIPVETTHADWGIVQWIAGILKLPPLDRREIQAGQKECRRMLLGDDGATDSTDEPVVAETERDAEDEPAAEDEEADWAEEASGIVLAYATAMNGDAFRVTDDFHLVSTPVFHHLWFLWFLTLMVPIFAVYACVAKRIRFSGLPTWLMLSPARVLWLIPLTLIPQSFMGVFMPSFGPDTSVGVIPQPHLLLYYGIFFAFGALYFDCDDVDGRLGRWWFVSLPLAIFIALPAGMFFSFTAPVRPVAVVAQTIYAWGMTFGMIGLFRQFMTVESKAMRYVSDSSYWLYLAHLPLVIWAQSFVREWPVSPFVKFTLICIILTGFLLFTYQTLVRYTWLGKILNGPRTRPSVESSVDSGPA